MLCWGNNWDSQLLRRDTERGGQEVTVPTENEFFRKHQVADVSAGKFTTVVISDGSVYVCGIQEKMKSELQSPVLLTSLEAHVITSVSCGYEHVIVVTSAGQLYSWGSNKFGQLGLGGTAKDQHISKPRQLKVLSQETVVQVSSGGYHSVALLQSGHVLSWGQNKFKQLGLGEGNSLLVDTPTRVELLQGVPIKQISSGGYHTFVLSLSGCLYGWGSNSHGQLGLGTVGEGCSLPKLLGTLRNLHPKYVSCGEQHTAFLMEDGGVFTCGRGYEGQLGHGTTTSISTPKKVVELMGSTVCQLTCGMQHTAVLEMNKGQVYCFGSNFYGQLGNGTRDNHSTPTSVGRIFSSSRGTLIDPNDAVVGKLVAGGNQTYVILSNQLRVFGVIDFRADPSPSSLPLYLTTNNAHTANEPIKRLDVVMTSPTCINGSFLTKDHHMMSHDEAGVDVASARNSFNKMIDLVGPIKALEKCDYWLSRLHESLPRWPMDGESVRCYLTLTTIPVFNLNLVNSHFGSLLEPFTKYCKLLTSSDGGVAELLGRWLVHSLAGHFRHLVTTVTEILNRTLLEAGKQVGAPLSGASQSSLLQVLQHGLPFLSLLNSWNKSKDGELVAHTMFYLSAVGQVVDLASNYSLWKSPYVNSSHSKVNFCQYPFTMDAACKGRLLELDSLINQQQVGQESMRSNISQGYLGRPFLDIVVNRSHVLRDAVQQLNGLAPLDLKKQLKVTFKGEEGDDEGGVRKEFFILVLKEILNPEYGLFKEDDESHLVWFNESLEVLNSSDDRLSYHLVGILCGMAIYNSAVIDIPFPTVIYKMILGSKPNLQDLMELRPSVARSLQNILDYDGNDIENDLSLVFEATTRVFGEVVTHPLVNGGSDIPVTMDNRHDYVKAYVSFVLLDSVKSLYSEFESGFLKLCGGEVLQLFHYQELSALVRGQKVIDFDEFEEIVQYHNGYHKNHPVIQRFWRVFHQLPAEGKKKFLAFLTGSDRIPVSGFKNMKVIIQRSDPGPSGDRLPVAHTCFNVLDLPPYPREDVMKQKLLQAINFTEGFGLL